MPIWQAICGTTGAFCLTPPDFAQARDGKIRAIGVADPTRGNGLRPPSPAGNLVYFLSHYKLSRFTTLGTHWEEMEMFSARKFLDRSIALSAVVLGVWTLSASPSMAAPPCALFCPFDTTLDAKKCRCVKNPDFTPINPCMLVCAPTWRLDAQKCRCIKPRGGGI
jgi:hypothetical protein